MDRGAAVESADALRRSANTGLPQRRGNRTTSLHSLIPQPRLDTHLGFQGAVYRAAIGNL